MSETPVLQILVSLDEPFDGEVEPDWLETVVQAGLLSAGIVGDSEVSLLITGDDTVRALNAEHRGLDETTDVLSFSAEHPGHWEGDGESPREQSPEELFVLPPGMPQPLGEIIVSWPQAQRQAAERRADPVQELAHLVIHGALHLVGHDHVEPEETARMQALEREALKSLFLDQPVTNGSNPLP